MKTLVVIFSMDRALQCDSLLNSLEDFATGIDRTVVIHRATSELHHEAYKRVQALHPTTQFCVEKDGFGCSHWLGHVVGDPSFTHVCINVDDQVYFRPVHFHEAAAQLDQADGFVWSWRLGHDPKWTRQIGNHWETREAANRHYGYLWHSDGALYQRETYIGTLDHCVPKWSTRPLIPNDLEWMPQGCQRGGDNRRLHLGPLKACTMTWQINKEPSTRDEYQAPWATVPETELDALAQAFLGGSRVNNQRLYEDLAWTRQFQRAGSPTHVHACPEASKFYASLIA